MSVTALTNSVKEIKKDQVAMKTSFVAALQNQVDGLSIDKSTGRNSSSTDYNSSSAGSNSSSTLKNRPGPDTEAEDGGVTCGRCHLFGHGRNDCPRQRYKCGLCFTQEHVNPECSQHKPRFGRNSDRSSSRNGEGGD